MLLNPRTCMKCMFCSEFSSSSTVPDVESSHPDVCPSLVHHCFHVISKDASLHVPSQLRTLPVPILEDFKFHLASDSLINLTSFFKECGIDTRLAWDHIVHKRFGSKLLSRCEAWISPLLGKFPFQLAVDCRHPRQVFLAKVCQKLTQHAMEAAEESFKQKGVAALTGHGKETTCRPCVTRFTSYLDFVTSFVMSWKQLSLISVLVSSNSDKYMTSALKSMLGHLVDLEIHHITFKSLDLVSDCLKQLITGGTLKSLAFLNPQYRYTKELGQVDMLMLLENLFLMEETEDLSTHSPSDTKAGHGLDIEDIDAKELSTHSSGDTIERQALDTEWSSPYLLGEAVEGHGLDIEEANDTEVGGETFDLFDEALNSNTDQSHVQYWMNDTEAMVNIRKKMKLWECEGLGNSNIGLESLRFALEGTGSQKIRYGRLAKVFQALKHVRRLCIDDVGNYDCEEVLIMLGCKRLTHLRLGNTQNEQAILLLFSIMFENYRLGSGSLPLDFLCLNDIFCSGGCGGPSVCHYDFEIVAVRKLELNSCQLSCCATDTLVHFLWHNTSLCHLELTDVQVKMRSSGEEWPPLTFLLKGITSISSLETLILRNTDHMFHCLGFMELRLRMREQRSALQSLIERRPNLKHLVLSDYSFSHRFGMDSDFLGVLKQNSNLEHLSLSNTPIGTSAIDLLLAISEPGSFRALKGLNLEHCDIAGKQLIDAGRQISASKKGALYLGYLNLDHNHISFTEFTEIQRLFSPCVTLLDIKSSSYQRESKLANFFEEEVV